MDSEHVRAARWAATATVLSTLIATTGTLAATGKISGGDVQAETPRVETSSSANVLPAALSAATAQISVPEDHRVDACTKFNGTGNTPDGTDLWIAVKDVQGYLFLAEPVDIRQGEWKTSFIQVSDGSAQDRTEEREVLALAVPRPLSDVLKDFLLTGIGPTTHELPGVRTLHEVRVTPLGSRAKCPA
jgi:hypothetical protein